MKKVQDTQVTQPVKVQQRRENAQFLEGELQWLSRIIDARFKLYFGDESDIVIRDIQAPPLKSSKAIYAKYLGQYQFGFTERLCLILALTPHVRPQLLDVFHIKNKNTDRRFTEFGGQVDATANYFLPTGETLAFLLAENDLEQRMVLAELLGAHHVFSRENILDVEPGPAPWKQPLALTEESLSFLLAGQAVKPQFSSRFPAHLLQTSLNWTNLILPDTTVEQIQEVAQWIKHGDTLLKDWEMKGKIRPGYRALFYGPPGTGKTMTASLLGKATQHDVYRIDLSTVVSKYIGETEKNLARIFDRAEHKKWILFFDEADALFGKRGETKGAHDRYANQEVSFLLQRIEDYHGIVILASNYKDNIDPAFARRFEAMIYFPMPDVQDRKKLWEQGFSKKAKLAEDISFEALAVCAELSGGAIINIIRFVSLKVLASGNEIITWPMIEDGIRKEMAKDGRVYQSKFA